MNFIFIFRKTDLKMFNVYEFDRRCSKNENERKKQIQEKITMHKLKCKNSELDV